MAISQLVSPALVNVTDSQNEFVVALVDMADGNRMAFYTTSSSFDPYAVGMTLTGRMISALGSPSGTSFSVTLPTLPAGFELDHLQIVQLSDGSYAAALELSSTTFSPPFPDTYIALQKFSSTGALIGGLTAVTPTSGAYAELDQLATRPGGGIEMSYFFSQTGATGDKLARFDNNLTATGTDTVNQAFSLQFAYSATGQRANAYDYFDGASRRSLRATLPDGSFQDVLVPGSSLTSLNSLRVAVGADNSVFVGATLQDINNTASPHALILWRFVSGQPASSTIIPLSDLSSMGYAWIGDMQIMPNGTVVVAYEADIGNGTPQKTYLRQFTSTGASLGAALPLGFTGGMAGIPLLSLASDGTLLAVFTATDSGADPTTDSYVQRFSTNTVFANNIIDGTGGSETINGTPEADTINAGAGDDTVNAGSSNDIVNGGDGADTLNGDNGADVLNGDAGGDTLNGGDGNDTLNGGDGNDFLNGGNGGDNMFGGAGLDTFNGGAGNDFVGASSSATQAVIATVTGAGSGTYSDGFGNLESFNNVENLGGTNFADQFTGFSADEGFTTYAGNDVVSGGTGFDTLFLTSANGNGFNGVNATLGATVNFLTGHITGAYANTDITFSGFERVRGTNLADTFFGGNSPTQTYSFSGLGGADTFTGGTGANDQIDYNNDFNAGGTAGVTVNLETGTAIDGFGATDTFTGIENVRGTSSVDTITGNAANNTLNGFGSNDTILAGAGDDTLIGGAGADLLNGGDGSDWVSNHSDSFYNGAVLAVNVNLAAQTQTDGFGNIDVLIGIENVSGTLFADTIVGDAGDNSFRGYEGADILTGGDGIDTISAYSPDIFDTDTDAEGRSLVGTQGWVVNAAAGTVIDQFGATDTISGIERFRATKLVDVMTGSAANEFFQGLDGADLIDGGAGIDTVEYGRDAEFGGTGGVAVNLVLGTATDGFGKTDTLAGIENVAGTAATDFIGGNAGNNGLRGNGGNDFLWGDAGDDELDGGAGADYLHGGTGVDLASYATATAGVAVNLTAPAANTGDAAGDTFIEIEGVIGSAFTDFFGGDGAANVFRGGAGNDFIWGDAGNDELEGGTGGDYLHGGAGIDLASYASATSGVAVNLASAAANTGDAAGDTFIEIEGVIGSAFTDFFGGDGAANVFRGGAGNDFIWGDAGDDELEGGTGADYLHGGAGIDLASYAGAAGGVTVNLASAAANTGEAAGDTFIEMEGVIGSAFTDFFGGDGAANVFRGGAGNDFIWGDAGDDELEGGTGADYLHGGAGTDLASYAHAAGGVTVNLTVPAANTGDAAGDVFIDIEGVIGTAFTDFFGGDTTANIFQGGAGNDFIWGDAGNDELEGGTGADYLHGGAGTDLASYAHAAGGVTVNLTAPVANTGEAAGDTFVEIEGVIGSAFTDFFGGDGAANTFQGGAGNDFIWGDGGDDVLEGGAGADYLHGGAGLDLASYAHAAGGVTVNLAVPAVNTGDAAGDTYIEIEGVIGSDFTDFFGGDGSANTFRGGAGNDFMWGDAGNDMMEGGVGGDYLHGGSGLDSFIYRDAFEGSDIIDDFVAADDTLVFHAAGFTGLIAGMDVAASGRLTLGSSAIGGVGQFIYNNATGALMWDFDGTGSFAATTIATINSKPTLTGADFSII